MVRFPAGEAEMDKNGRGVQGTCSPVVEAGM